MAKRKKMRRSARITTSDTDTSALAAPTASATNPSGFAGENSREPKRARTSQSTSKKRSNCGETGAQGKDSNCNPSPHKALKVDTSGKRKGNSKNESVQVSNPSVSTFPITRDCLRKVGVQQQAKQKRAKSNVFPFIFQPLRIEVELRHIKRKNCQAKKHNEFEYIIGKDTLASLRALNMFLLQKKKHDLQPFMGAKNSEGAAYQNVEEIFDALVKDSLFQNKDEIKKMVAEKNNVQVIEKGGTKSPIAPSTKTAPDTTEEVALAAKECVYVHKETASGGAHRGSEAGDDFGAEVVAEKNNVQVIEKGGTKSPIAPSTKTAPDTTEEVALAAKECVYVHKETASGGAHRGSEAGDDFGAEDTDFFLNDDTNDFEIKSNDAYDNAHYNNPEDVIGVPLDVIGVLLLLAFIPCPYIPCPYIPIMVLIYTIMKDTGQYVAKSIACDEVCAHLVSCNHNAEGLSSSYLRTCLVPTIIKNHEFEQVLHKLYQDKIIIATRMQNGKGTAYKLVNPSFKDG